MEPQPPIQVADDSFDVQIIESDSGVGEVEAVQTMSVDQDPLNVPENSKNSAGKALKRRPAKGGRSKAGRMQPVKAMSTDSKANDNAENSGIRMMKVGQNLILLKLQKQKTDK